jgi:hypothetical protein
MRALVRFWIVIGSLLVALGAFVSLFVSFLIPNYELALATSGARLVVIAVALVAMSTFVWAAVFLEAEQPTPPEE